MSEGRLKTDEKTRVSAGCGSNPEPSDHVVRFPPILIY